MNADAGVAQLIERKTGLAAMHSQAGLTAFKQAMSLDNSAQVLVLHGDAARIRDMVLQLCFS